jgi:hypothetical protein
MADIKDDEVPRYEDKANILIALLEKKAKQLLSPEANISKADKERIASTAAKLRRDFDQFSCVLKFISTNPNTVDLAFGVLTHLMADMVFIGTFRYETPQAEKRFAKLQAAVMRDIKRKQNAPQEAALMAAIIAERGNGPAAQPKKEAGAILSDVNKRLRADGFEEVKIDVIRRRLQKFPAHS